ncbi:hypothetical protein E4P41_02110 [Geodermatophilus sp. DF01-2]|uniref:hypothetical protein n=1 Tax=Geodermatophilus sp. DF01-2 TaxID=2559610 RepID=UPI00107326DF|nr:hypothetical protein [Geodermatophilus sp. DF01_2]TFV64360.1 hypothetical protein E4P41_02110 [Geodermatophilus sp. DF01_2]
MSGSTAAAGQGDEGRPAGGTPIEVFDHPGSGHLFTDPSLPAEDDARAAEQLWQRALASCRSPGSAAVGPGT